MKHHIAAALIAAAALALPLASPAAAAVPKSKPGQVIPCGGTSRKSAQVWRTRSDFAAQNPCDQWLRITWHWDDEGDSNGNIVNVEPGAHFNWRLAGSHLVTIATLGAPDYCAPSGIASIVRKGSHGKGEAAPPCGS